jgi:hypothetical protein
VGARPTSQNGDLMMDVSHRWLIAAVYAKLCGATDPAAVVEAAVADWGIARPNAKPEEYLAHIRLIQRLAEQQRALRELRNECGMAWRTKTGGHTHTCAFPPRHLDLHRCACSARLTSDAQLD